MSVYQGANPFDRLPVGVKRLVIVIFLAFLAQMIFPDIIMKYFSLRPADVLKNFYVWQYLTYSFLHGNFLHLFLNVWALWMFGPPIEYYWGTKKFLIYYFVCVVGAAIGQTLVSPDVMVVGASGGIYGLLLAFGFLFPDAIISIFFFLPLRAIQAVMVFGLITLAFSLQSGGERIAHFAHLSGMLTGYLYFKLPVWFHNVGHWKKRNAFSKLHVISGDRTIPADQNDLSVEVDRILDKISSRGVDSLTDKEREIMRRYSSTKN